MFWIIGLGIAAVAAVIMAWQWDLLPREVIQTGTVTTSDGKVLKPRQYYRTTRDAAYKSPAPGPIKKTAVWEVQLPSGRWVDCDGNDCLAVAERAMKQP